MSTAVSLALAAVLVPAVTCRSVGKSRFLGFHCIQLCVGTLLVAAVHLLVFAHVRMAPQQRQQ